MDTIFSRSLSFEGEGGIRLKSMKGTVEGLSAEPDIAFSFGDMITGSSEEEVEPEVHEDEPTVRG